MSSNLPSSPQPSQGLGGSTNSSPAVGADKLLPPVEPPSAAFLLQLFVIPAVIVAAVVFLWFVIESLARRGEQDPDQIVAGLRSSNQARFQRANELADMLRMPQRYPKLKTSHELAQKLAVYLDEQVDAADKAEAAITMRMFLCTAIGEFQVDDGLAVLLKAARTDSERDVRRKAINAIAVLAGTLGNLKPPQPIDSDEVAGALVQLADDHDALIRSETAFTAGIVESSSGKKADPRLVAKLHELADDPVTDARFNAAIGLARIGDPRSAEGLAEMLDADALASSVAGEKAMTEEVTEQSLRSQKAFKRNTIINSALTGATMLLEHGPIPQGPLTALETALTKFIAAAPGIQEPAPIPRELVNSAERELAAVTAALHDR